MKLVVLGWDALDAHYIEKYGHEEAFGVHHKRIDTYVNPYIESPHTLELWPSLITGRHPDGHGIHAATEGDGVNWDSDLLRVASRVSEGLVPDDLKAYIGKRLRENGVGLDVTTADYYAENGLDPVVSGPNRRAISIPNYQTDQDRALGLDAHRDSLWEALNVDKSLDHGMVPRVDRDRVAQLLGEAVGKRLGATTAATSAGNELVWTWFGLLDSVGHMEPGLGEATVERWYNVAANVTETVRQQTDEETVVISVSDHGIRGGSHTEYATIACQRPGIIDSVEHVFDVADMIRGLDLRPDRTAVDADGDMRDVQAELESLGYIET
jgi:hypothetical protein